MNMGFAKTGSSAVALCHPGLAWTVVHGDDFASTGMDMDLNFVLMELNERPDPCAADGPLGTKGTFGRRHGMIVELQLE